MSDDNRINVLERRVDDFSISINGKLDAISNALITLVRIEERQVNHDAKLTEIKKSVEDQESRLRKIELALPDELDKRLGNIEKELPPLLESRKWVTMGLLGGIAMIGVSMMHIVLKP